MLRKTAVILAVLLSSLATQVFALGLGTVTVESALNQPLRVRIEILQLGSTRLQDVTVQMASVADFQRFNIDRVNFLSNVQFNVSASPDGNYVTLTSNQIVREPYLSFILDTRWPNGRLLSEHTILLDLPVFDQQTSGATPVRQPISPVLTPPGSTPSPAPAPTVSTPTAPAVEEPPAAEPAAPEPTPAPAPAPETTTAATSGQTSPAAEPEVAVEEVAADPAEAAPATIETTANDTLSDIALQVRPDDSVSIQQTMLALQRLNPDAFTDGNINNMRAGEILRVPTLNEIQSIDTREAADEITRQNQDFASADIQPLAAPSAQTPDQDAAPQGQLSVVTNDGAIDASAGTGQQESAANQELDQRIAELENQLAVQQEEADRARIEREDLDARLDELEAQIAAAQEIIRLQDEQLALLQETLAQAAAQQAEMEAQNAAIVAAEQQVAQQTAARTSVVGDLMRIITGNILFIGFGVVLAILLLVVLLLRRNRAKIDDSDINELDDDEFVPREKGVDDGAQEFQDYDDDDLDNELDQIIGVDAGGDPVEQASGLLKKGNYARAISLLQSALETSPDDNEVRLKLLEAFAAEGDLSAFEEQADIIGDDPEYNARINTLRRNIDVKPVPTEPAPSFSARDTDEEDRLGAASFLDDLGIDLDAFDDDDDEPSITERSEKPAAPVVEKKSEAPSLDDDSFHPDDMDLTFDLVDDGNDSADTAPQDDSDDSLDELELPDADEPQEDVVEPTAEIDFEIEEPAANEPDTDIEIDADSDEAEDGGLEFEVDDLPDTGAASGGKDADELDIESFEFEVDDTPAASGPADDEPEIELETFAFDTDGLDVDKSPEPEVAADVATDDEENLLDFDFDKNEIPTVADTDKDSNDEELETFEFDVDTSDDDSDTSDSLDTVVESSDTPVELDIDIDDMEVSATESDDSVSKDDDDDDFLDLDAMDDDVTVIESATDSEVRFDLDDDDDDDAEDDDDAPVSSDSAAESIDDDLDDLDFLSDEEDIDLDTVEDTGGSDSVLADAEEVATKLELAYAYRKMGDVEGAREILQEVMKEGTPDQMKEASDLLSSLDAD